MKTIRMILMTGLILLLSWCVLSGIAYSTSDGESKMSDLEQAYKEQHDELTEKICRLFDKNLKETVAMIEYQLKYDDPSRPKSRTVRDMERSIDNDKEELNKAETSRNDLKLRVLENLKHLPTWWKKDPICGK